MEHKFKDASRIICLIWSGTDDKNGITASLPLLGHHSIDLAIRYSEFSKKYTSRISICNEEVYLQLFNSPKEAAIDMKDALKVIVSNIVGIL